MKPSERVPGRARRLRSLALNLGLVLVSFGFAGLLAEAAVRVVAPQQLITIRPDLWQPADTVGWLHRPGVSTEINTGERTVSIHTDLDGFRVGEDGRVSEGAEVLILGDSFIEALQVEYEQSVSGFLQETLPALAGQPVAVRNAAVGGWDPDQYVLRAETLLAERSYALVITAVYLGNDIIDRRRDYVAPREAVTRHSLRLPRRLSREEFINAILAPVNDLLEIRSHLYLLFKNRLQTVRMKLGLAVLTFPPPFLKSEADSVRWDLTADLFEEIGDLAVESGARALFVLVPTPFQVDSADLAIYVRGYDLDPNLIDLDQPNRRLVADLTSRGLTVYDPLLAFRAAHDQGELLYGTVDQHFSPAGNELFASLVAPLAADMLSSRESESAGTSPSARE